MFKPARTALVVSDSFSIVA